MIHVYVLHVYTHEQHNDYCMLILKSLLDCKEHGVRLQRAPIFLEILKLMSDCKEPPVF